MWGRVLALTSARLRATGWDATGPLASLLLPAFLSVLFGLLVSSELAPFPYAFFGLGLSAALVAVPLLGEFSSLLREDPTGAWIMAQPVRESELVISRLLTLAVGVGALAAATLLPYALLAPSELGVLGRVLYVLAGVGQAFLIAALLLFLQRLLGGRLDGLLVLLQAVFVVTAIVGGLASLEALPALARVSTLAELPESWSFSPPARFAAAVTQPSLSAWSIPLGMTLAALAALVLTPPVAKSAARGGGGLLSLALTPLRRLAARLWVKREERGAFEFVYDALPLERDFVLRSYPLVGIPLAFLFLGLRSRTGEEAESMLALVLFTTATYLPVLFAHVPVTSTPEARWLLETAPTPPDAIFGGSYKAVVVRFIVPLYVGLAVTAGFLAGPAIVPRLAFPAFAVALLASRMSFPEVVQQPPLSFAPEDVSNRDDVLKVMMGLGIALAILSVLANAQLRTPMHGLVVGAVILLPALLSPKAPEPAPEPTSESVEETS